MRNEDLNTEDLEKKFSRWSKTVNGLKIALGFYAFLVLTFLAVQGIIAQQQMAAVLKKVEDTTQQVRASQLANQKTGTENHEKTRAYIKCLVTEVLTVPLAERKDIDLDSCTKRVDEQAETDAKTDTSSTNQPSSVVPSPTTVNPKPTEPVATAPPDPEPTDDRSELGKLPLVGGLLNALGL